MDRIIRRLVKMLKFEIGLWCIQVQMWTVQFPAWWVLFARTTNVGFKIGQQFCCNWNSTFWNVSSNAGVSDKWVIQSKNPEMLIQTDKDAWKDGQDWGCNENLSRLDRMLTERWNISCPTRSSFSSISLFANGPIPVQKACQSSTPHAKQQRRRYQGQK